MQNGTCLLVVLIHVHACTHTQTHIQILTFTSTLLLEENELHYGGEDTFGTFKVLNLTSFPVFWWTMTTLILFYSDKLKFLNVWGLKEVECAFQHRLTPRPSLSTSQLLSPSEYFLGHKGWPFPSGINQSTPDNFLKHLTPFPVLPPSLFSPGLLHSSKLQATAA